MAHHHHHHHHHHDDSGVGERNKEHFNNMDVDAFTQSAVFKRVAEQITQELQQSFPWMGINTDTTEENPIRMLDYACGNGIVSRALATHFPVIRGIDISSNMVQAYNAEATKAGFPCERMHAIEGDVLADKPFPNADFDLIVMSLALHHIQDPATLIQRLSNLLRPGGVLIILDWVDRKESGCAAHSSQFDHIVTRHGFTETEVQSYYSAAGLDGWKWRLFDEMCELPADMSGPQQAFMARGTKPTSAQ